MPSRFYPTYLSSTPNQDFGSGSRCITPVAAFIAGNDPITGVAGAVAVLDLTADAAAGNLDYVQGLYLDLADVAAGVSVSVINTDTGFRVKAKGQTQGWYGLALGNTLKFAVSGPASLIGSSLALLFTNVPVPTMQWATA